MIPQIEEYFGEAAAYATLNNATVSLSEMGDRIISTQVKIDGDIVPNFDGWELRFRGERFVLNVKDPQAAKDNTSVDSVISLTFYSWVILQLKRYFMFTVPATATGIITADQYNAPVSLDIQNFGTLLRQVLEYYFHGKITVAVYPGATSEIASMEINYTKIWDVMQKIFELYGVRWRIDYDSEQDNYTIKIGYPADEINDHEFEYGFEGGLMRFERQVQNADITNILLGRGGTRNVPYRYFKKTDPQNPEWSADPDAIPELANLYMDRIRDINFRWYVRGWVKNENRDTFGDEGYTLPDYDDSDVPSQYLWAYQKGRYEDTVFDPVEYVKDDASILKYGEHWGHLDDDDDIYPTIQGVPVGGARADLVVAVSAITTDDIHATSEAAANIVDLSNGVVNQTNDIEPDRTGMDLQYEEIYGDIFTVPTGMIANLAYNDFFITANAQRQTLLKVDIVESESRVVVVRESDGVEVSPSGLVAGTYRYIIYVAISNINNFAVNNATYGVNGLRLELSSAGSGDEWKPTFDIWIRNIFDSVKPESESPEDYALRVWGPILGDRLGNEAAIAFSDGQMSISEDYTFKIASYPEFDRSKTLNGERSEWKITLVKSDAEFDATGYYIPNSTTGGKPIAGDHFYFLGIDMPHFYVEKAEERVNDNKALELYQISDINPTWVVALDHVRMDEEYNEYQERLFDKIEAGVKMFVYDKRFSGGATLALFASSVTFTWSDDTVILPSVEVVLTDKVAVTKSQIADMRGDINNLKSSIAQMSGVENLVRESIKPLFLGKTGEEQTSLSPTKFSSLLTSEDFKQGGFGGQGWGFYRDNTKVYQDLEADTAPAEQTQSLRSAPALRAAEEETESVESDGTVRATPSVRSGSQSVLEVDKLIVRRDMHVNNLVVNQIAYVGGKQIISAAAMECVQVVETDTYYDCYFDQKQGSVKNLFKVYDIAMGQVFTADNLQLRFYKCVVIKVGLDYIRLSKSQKYGSGVPAKGDVIVQFGNTKEKSRQYAIIRDVIGGGYEQMLSDLDSIYNNGVEYYFAGLNYDVAPEYEDLADNQDVLLATKSPEDKILAVKKSPRPRFFIGNADSNIDYTAKDGIMRLKGNIVQSPSGAEFPVPCWRGEYSADKWYYYGDLVIYNASNWIHIGKERTKGTTPATGNVWRLYTESRPIAYGDLDNEMDAIGVGEDGILDVAIPKSNALTTTFRIYYGTTSMPLTALTVSGVPNGISYERVQSNGVYTGQIKFWAPTVPVDLSAGRYAITISGSASINNQTVTYDAVYTLMGARQGIDGATFILVPNINAVKKTAAGVISDAYITCDATDSTGTQLETFYIYYSKDGGTKALYKQRVDGGSVTYGTGLSSGIPTNDMTTNVKLYLYLTSSDVTNDKYIDTETIPMIIDGNPGTNGVAVFRWNQSATDAPSISGTAYPPTNWSKTAPSRPGDGYYLWMSTGNQVSASAVDAWSTPVRISGDKGTPGEDAADIEWIYYRNSEASYGTAPASITKDKDGVQRDAAYIASHDDFVPYGWTDNPQGVTSVYKFEYAAFREKARGGSTWGAFSTPILWSHYGERGIDGDGIEYVYVRTNSATAPTITNSDDTYDGKTYVDDDYQPLSSAGRCTDDPTGVDSTHMYEWVAMRTKGAPSTTLGSEGVRTWNKYSGTMALWAKYGEKGSTGRVMRGLREWTSGTVYQGYNDDFNASTENIFYDVVWIPDPNDSTQKLYFYCKTGHTASNSNKPVSGGNTYWASANQFDFVATKVFLAQNAQIDFLTGNDIMVKDANGNVVAGMLGGTGVNFFAGPGSGDTWKEKAAAANFSVDNSGNVRVYGKIIAAGNAGQGHGSALVSTNGLFISSGNSYFQGDILGQSIGGDSGCALQVEKDSSSAQHWFKAINGSNIESSVQASASGVITTLLAKDASHYARLQLFGTTGDIIINRGTPTSHPDEHILSSATYKHIEVVSSDPSPSTADANTIYIVVPSS